MLVIDSNVLFSALIKDSVTRRIILESKEKFLLPYYFFEELKSHKQLIKEKTRLTDEELDILMGSLLNKIEIVPKHRLSENSKEAFDLLKDIDMNDTPFVACALAYPGSAIWSDDKRLKQIKKIKVISTKELI